MCSLAKKRSSLFDDYANMRQGMDPKWQNAENLPNGDGLASLSAGPLSVVRGSVPGGLCAILIVCLLAAKLIQIRCSCRSTGELQINQELVLVVYEVLQVSQEQSQQQLARWHEDGGDPAGEVRILPHGVEDRRIPVELVDQKASVRRIA